MGIISINQFDPVQLLDMVGNTLSNHWCQKYAYRLTCLEGGIFSNKNLGYNIASEHSKKHAADEISEWLWGRFREQARYELLTTVIKSGALRGICRETPRGSEVIIFGITEGMYGDYTIIAKTSEETPITEDNIFDFSFKIEDWFTLQLRKSL